MAISDSVKTVTMAIEGIESITPAAQEVLQRAEQQARMMGANTLYPEHLFLSVLTADNEQVAVTLRNLGLDQRQLSQQVLTLMAINDAAGARVKLVEFSKEVEDCLSWAATFTASLHMPHLQPEHILLGAIRHPRVQPLLDLLLSQIEVALPSYVSEETPTGYSRAVDQLIRARVRAQQRILSPAQQTQRMLTSLERPAVTFADILGFSRAKEALWPFIDILRKPRRAQSSRQASMYGVVLVGSPGNNRSLLVRAMAGEAVVPLICLSISALISMMSAVSSDEIGDFDVALSNEQYREASEQHALQKGREFISAVFQQARQAAPCILLVEDCEALTQAEASIRMHLLKQLLVEIDACVYHPSLVVVAAVQHSDRLDPALLLPGRLEHRVVLDGAMSRLFVHGVGLCPTCQHEVSMHWKYCIYCGEALARTCMHCGERLPDVEGMRFCPECGAVNTK